MNPKHILFTQLLRTTGLSKRVIFQVFLCLFLLGIAVYISLPAHAQDSPTISIFPENGTAGQLIQIGGNGFTPGGYQGSILVNEAIVDSFDIPGLVIGGPPGGAFSIPFFIPVDLAEGVHTIEVCSDNPCSTGDFEQRSGAKYIVEAAAPKIGGAIAYVFNNDKGSAEIYARLLGDVGYEVTPITLDDVLATDFEPFDLVIIGNDTDGAANNFWGTDPTQDQHIASFKRPILGLGAAGSFFFEDIQPSLSTQNLLTTISQTNLYTDNFEPLTFYTQPYSVLDAQRNPFIDLYDGDGVSALVLNARTIESLEPISYEGTAQRGLTVAADDCRLLWGYDGSPDQLSIQGRGLFVNAVFNTMARRCEVAPPRVCTPIERPELFPESQALINFDKFGEKDIDSGNVLSTLYQADFGVTFGETQLNQVIATNEAVAPKSPPNVALNNSLDPQIGSDDVPLTFTFDEPKSHVGFYIGANQTLDTDATLTAYDATGAPVCLVSRTFVPAGHTEFLGVQDPASSIVRVTFDYGGSFEPESIDDLIFSPYTPPEPPLQQCEVLESETEIPDPSAIYFDFDNDEAILSGTPLSRYYADDFGVTFVETAFGQVQARDEFAAPPSSPNVALNTVIPTSLSNATGPMRIDFAEGKTHVGFYFGTTETLNGAALLTAYDQEGNPFCQVRRDPPVGGTTEFLGIRDSDFRIASVELLYPEGRHELIDDLYFAPKAPERPEPPQPHQIRVCQEGPDGCTPVADATLHAIENGISLAQYRTDEQGLVEVTETISGNQVWAMVDVSNELSATMPISNTERYSVYFTSLVTPIVDAAFDENNLITVPVTAGLPLMLYHAQVSSEWVLEADPDYKELLESRIISGSNYLYDFSDSQFALGNVTIYQDTEKWPTYENAPENADVRLYANNNLRPQAEPGGVVSELISDTVNLSVGYRSGYILMGSEWNRYFLPPGDPNIEIQHSKHFTGTEISVLREDWSLAFAHEWGHYLLFLFDTYLKLVEEGEETLVEQVDDCKYSAMGWFYEEENRHFIRNRDDWAPCAETIANTQLQRPEWDVISDWYPWVVSPTTFITGPVAPPIQLTNITFVTPTVNLDDVIEPTDFTLTYQDQVATAKGASIQARGFVIREDGRVIDQGAPGEESTELELIGGQVGDRFCVVDINQKDDAIKQRFHYGCEILEEADTELLLEKDPAWAPVIEPLPIGPQEWQVVLTNITDTLPISVTFYPEATADPQSTVVEVGTAGVATGTISLNEVTSSAYIEVVVRNDTDSEDDPARRAFVDFGIGGGSLAPGSYWGSHSPIYSPDGTVEFYRTASVQLGGSEFVAVVRYLNTYPLPENTVGASIPYGIVAWPPTLVDAGLINFRLTESLSFPNGGRAQAAGDDSPETKMVIHHWNGSEWTPLGDTRFTGEPNGERLASARSAGAGIYIVLEVPIQDVLDPPNDLSLYLPLIN